PIDGPRSDQPQQVPDERPQQTSREAALLGAADTLCGVFRRRMLLVPALASALALSLTACGSDSDDDGFPGSGKTAQGLDAVTITGDVGSAPTVTWKSQMSAGAVKS